MARRYLIDEDELTEGEQTIVTVEGTEIGIFRIDGEFHAYTNWCPHQNGPVCEGNLGGTTVASFDRETLHTDISWDLDDRVLTCPWHSWEFDAVTGECLSRTDRRLLAHELHVEEGAVYLEE